MAPPGCVEFSDKTLGLVAELRSKFKEQYGANMGEFDARDVERMEKNDAWLAMFLVHNHDDVAKSVKHLLDVLKWRKEHGVNDLTEEKIDKATMEDGIFYPRYKTKQGYTIIWFRQKAGDAKTMYKRPATREALLFTLEWIMRNNVTQQVSTVSDFKEGYHSPGTDLVDFGKFGTSAMTYYYPGIVGKQLSVDMPFVYKFVAKILTAMMNADIRARIFYIKAAEVKNDIDTKYLPSHLGGTNTTYGKYVAYDTYKDETVNKEE